MSRGSVSAVLAGVVVLLGLAVIARTLALGVGGGLRLYLLRPWRRS